MRLNPLVVGASVACLISAKILAVEAWPQFRGPNGAGIGDKQDVPTQFGPGTNEVYHVPIPPGASSPCVWADRIFLTAVNAGKLELLCLNRRDGMVLWTKTAPAEKLEEFHPSEGSPAASTPATDGEREYVYFRSCGLFGHTLDGHEVWRMAMPPARHVGDFGSGTSPIVHNGIVLLNRDMLSGSFLIAVDAKSGKTLWRQERPDALSSYSTPVIWNHDQKVEAVVAGTLRMKAYNLKTGDETWQINGMPSAACTTPVLGEGMLFSAGWSPGSREMPLPPFAQTLEKIDQNKDGAIQKEEAASQPMIGTLFTFWDMDGNGKITQDEWEARIKKLSQAENSVMAVRPGNGDISQSGVVWKQTRGLPYVPSPLYYKGSIYLVKDGGIVSCFDAKTGRVVYQEERIGSIGSYYSSPVATDGKIIIVSVNGKATVFAAGEKPEILSRSDLGERCVTTPALAHNTIYVRTAGYLWAFGNKR